LKQERKQTKPSSANEKKNLVTKSLLFFMIFLPSLPFAFPLNASGTLHLHEHTSQLFGLLPFSPVTGCLLHDLVNYLAKLLSVQPGLCPLRPVPNTPQTAKGAWPLDVICKLDPSQPSQKPLAEIDAALFQQQHFVWTEWSICSCKFHDGSQLVQEGLHGVEPLSINRSGVTASWSASTVTFTALKNRQPCYDFVALLEEFVRIVAIEGTSMVRLAGDTHIIPSIFCHSKRFTVFPGSVIRGLLFVAAYLQIFGQQIDAGQTRGVLNQC
jgi:hypothetical protein